MGIKDRQLLSVTMKIRTKGLPVDVRNGEVWDIFLGSITEESLEALNRGMRDPFAWRWLLGFSQRMILAGAGVGPGYLSFLGKARNQLDRKGLRILPLSGVGPTGVNNVDKSL